jgi:hypothetical protein
MNLTTATPVEIDTELNRIYGEIAATNRDSNIARETIARIDSVVAGSYDSYYWTPEKRTAEQARIAANDAKFYELAAEAAPLEARYDAERWNRYYLVDNSNGHVHTHQDCRTCYATTQFVWLTEFSGADHDTVTAEAGELSCAECFPNLPADIMARKTRIEAPAKRTARLEREAKKAAALAKKIANGLTADGSEFRIEWFEGGYVNDRNEQGQQIRVWKEGTARRYESFKTERAASMFYVDAYAWGQGPNPSKREALTKIVEAMAAKHNKTTVEVLAELDAKITAKKKRDGIA